MFRVPVTLEKDVARIVKGTKFRAKSQKIKKIIIGAIRQADFYYLNPVVGYQQLKPTRQNFGTLRKRGRKPLKNIRYLIYSALFRSWLLGFSEIPKINNKNYRDTKFVSFARLISELVGLGKVLQNLEDFRSYRKQLFLQNLTDFKTGEFPGGT